MHSATQKVADLIQAARRASVEVEWHDDARFPFVVDRRGRRVSIHQGLEASAMCKHLARALLELGARRPGYGGRPVDLPEALLDACAQTLEDHVDPAELDRIRQKTGPHEKVTAVAPAVPTGDSDEVMRTRNPSSIAIPIVVEDECETTILGTVPDDLIERSQSPRQTVSQTGPRCMLCGRPEYGTLRGLSLCRDDIVRVLEHDLRPDEVHRLRERAPRHPELEAYGEDGLLQKRLDV